MDNKSLPNKHQPTALNSYVMRAAIILALLGITGFGTWLYYKIQRPQPGPIPMSSAGPFQPTVPNTGPPPGETPDGMVWIPGGEFSMGAQDPPGMDDVGMQATRDSRPIHRVYVDGFWMDKSEVTNEQFEKFVNDTGYVTVAERVPTQEEFPTAPPENLVAGSVVFTPLDHPVPLDNHFRLITESSG